MTPEQFDLLIYELRLLREALTQLIRPQVPSVPLAPRQPNPDYFGNKCLICGSYHGHGMPCPQWMPQSSEDSRG